jgi:class 3 adenylate cyclase/pimeloyl-ACP methyl ester carboxylesterase
VQKELDVRYTKTTDGLHIAYATIGEGPPDLVVVVGAPTHLQLYYDEPVIRHWYQRMASFCRLVQFDDRGAGMSDPVSTSELPTLEERMDDLRAVLDALEIERVTLFGYIDGGALALLFSATHPERVERLILWSPVAAYAAAPDYPIGIAPGILEEIATRSGEMWRNGETLKMMAPSADGLTRERLQRALANAASPGQVEATVRRMYMSDVRAVLSTISVPTLILHREDSLVPIAMVRYVAEHIHGGRFVTLPGIDAYPFVGDVDASTDEVEEFVTGKRASHDVNRVLATVLFTDIVDSTKRASDLGDRRWREVLDDHDAMVLRQLERFQGRAVKNTGDGFMASFDGPARAMRCACSIRDGARRLGLEIRAGLHTGECEIRGDDLGGIAVHVGARVGALAEPGEVLVSSTVKDLVVGSGIEFSDRGEQALKGVPETWRIFAVEG